MNNIDKIVSFMESGQKTSQRIGLELEHFVCDRDYRVISYPEMAECLEEMSLLLQGRPVGEGGNVFGVLCDNFTLSLEPGCQLEISISPQDRIENIRKIYRRFKKAADHILEKKGFYLLEKGVFPLIEN